MTSLRRRGASVYPATRSAGTARPRPAMTHRLVVCSLVAFLLAASAPAVEVATPQGRAEVAHRGDLIDVVALVSLTGAEVRFSRAAGSYTASLGEHEVQFTPGGTLAVADGRLEQLPGPVRAADSRLLAAVETCAVLVSLLGWSLEGDTSGLTLGPAGAGERLVVSTVRAAEGTLVVLRGTTQKPQVSSRAAEVVLRFPRPVQLAEPITAQGELLGGSLEGNALTLTLAPGIEVAATYPLSDPPRFVLRLAGAQPLAGVETGRSGPLVVLDPGHGGDDRGAIGPHGELEKDLTLQIARLTAARLQAAGVTARLTRDGDEAVALTDRTALANRLRADVFVSIHANASLARGAHGAETYFMSAEATDSHAAQAAATENASAPQDTVQLILWDLAQTANLNESALLARVVQERLNALQEIRDRGVKQAPFVVLTGATMPAVLVEVGFLSNPDEAARLTARPGGEALAAAMVEALTAYLARPAELTATP